MHPSTDTDPVADDDGGAPTRRPFRADIQGLRAVSVLLVVLYHARLSAASGGYIGVDVFFVISGYLITQRLVGELAVSGTVSLRGFYAGRARRILPMAMLVAVVTVIASVVVLAPLPARRVAGDTVAAGAYVINYRLAGRQTNYFASAAPPSPLQHYWSLAIEEQFYLLWPVVVIAASRARRRDGDHPAAQMAPLAATAAAIVVVSFGLSVTLTATNAPLAYFSLLTRAWELGAGALLAVAARLRPQRDEGSRAATAMGVTGLAAIGAAAVVFSDATAYPGYAAALPVAGAGLVLWSGRSGTGLRPLGWGPLRRIGDVSYSWYLWHFPALVLVPVVVGHALSVPAALVLGVVTLGIAHVSYALVEDPVRRARPLVRRPLGSIGAGLAASAVTVTVGLVAIAALPSFTSPAGAAAGNPPLGVNDVGRLAAAITSASGMTALPTDLTPSLGAAADDLPRVYADGCNVSYTGTTSPSCVYGDAHSATTVVLFGDSHAAQWFPAMEAISIAEHWKLLSLTKLACPAVDVPMFNTTLRRRYTECTTWLHATEARIRAAHPALVVVSSMRSYTDTTLAPSKAAFEQQWGAGTVQVLHLLRGAGTTVVMLQDIPLPRANIPDCLSGHPGDIEACAVDPAAATNEPARRAAEPAWAAAAGVARIDPAPWFCARSCPPVVDHLLVYRDDSHCTPEYGTWIAPILLGALQRADPALGAG